MLSFLAPPIQISFKFNNAEERKTTVVDTEKNGTQELFVFKGTDPVVGKIELQAPGNKTIQHQGIVAELVGQIDQFNDRSSQYEFTSLVNSLEEAGDFRGNKVYDVDFSSVQKQCDSYSGLNVALRYFVRITVKRQFAANISKEFDFWVQNSAFEPDINNSIKMEVGIEDCLHIEFEYNKSKYHLQDVVVGKVFFLLVRIKIKHMELAIIKRETTGSGSNVYNESETMTKYEVMDGAPVRGETIPVRLFLSGCHLAPTYRNVHSQFSVKYYVNLVLVDEEERRYFKQQEISLYRQEL